MSARPGNHQSLVLFNTPPAFDTHIAARYHSRMERTLQLPELTEVFRANIVARRAELGITQMALSKKTGFTQPFIAQMEAGIRVPTFASLVKLAEALKTTPDALLSPKIFASE